MRDTKKQLTSGYGYVTEVDDSKGKRITVTSAQPLCDNSYTPDVKSNNKLFKTLMALLSCAQKMVRNRGVYESF